MTDQNTDHAQLVAGDHNYSDSRWRESYLTRPYYQEAQLTTPDLDYDRDFSAAYELGHRARSESKEGTLFEDMEDSLQQKWEHLKAESRLKWEHAKQAIKDAWDDM
ncbi:surface antigen protein 1 [Acinetobacter sp. XH1741]|uniref:surface antigen protein 1 n=1 Tax=unclassified Acinetobacter TaxID=196816 RepID=UPI0032B3DC64